jgi:hypothetical protein
MMLKQFVEKLRPMLKNPNALLVNDDVIYIYTIERELIAFDTDRVV